MKRTVFAVSSAVLGLLPLAFKMPYIVRSWRESPLDRYEWMFGLLFLLMTAISCRKVYARRGDRIDYGAFLVIGCAAAGIAFGWQREIHAVAIAGSMIFAWGMLDLGFGWRSAYTALPAYLMLLLMCTSSRYWLSYFLGGPLGLDGLLIKALLAVFLGAWQALNLLYRGVMTRESVIFHFTGAAVLLMIMQTDTLQSTNASFLPDFKTLRAGESIGRRLEPTPQDLRFFADSRISKYFFVSDAGTVQILAVLCGRNVHKIHPASHCMRAGGRRVYSENIIQIMLGTRPMSVLEIESGWEHDRTLTWVWYSNPFYSTASFLGFRRKWRPEIEWHSYQVTTPVTASRGAARSVLRTFLAAVPVHAAASAAK